MTQDALIQKIAQLVAVYESENRCKVTGLFYHNGVERFGRPPEVCVTTEMVAQLRTGIAD